VLVVDDNATNRRIFERTLSKWRMKPTLMDSGSAALTASRAARDSGQPFDVVLLDVQMPGLDGFETAARLKADAGGIAPTIMMLTSADHLGDAAKCRTLGLDAYLVKPVRQASLRAAMLRALHHTPSSAAPRLALAWQRPRTPRRILLAEDNVVNQRVAMGILNKVGHTVVLAANGIEAVAAVEAGGVDLILMDMQMPEMGGEEATGLIRAREREHGGHVPIIALTAHAMKGDREICLAAGADGYVPKPLSPQHLLDQIDELIGNLSTPAVVPDQERQRLLASVGHDEALFAEVVQLFTTDAPAQLARIRGAIATGSGEAIYRAAHTFHGAAANFGRGELLESLSAMEQSANDADLPTCVALLEQVTWQTAHLLEQLVASTEVP